MKQTVEEAAIESCVIDRSIYNDEYQPYYLDGFKKGAKMAEKEINKKFKTRTEMNIK